MSKLDELKKASHGIAAESMGRSLTSSPIRRVSTPARWQGVTKSKDAVEVPVDMIAPDPDQPREEFDEESLGRLAESIRTRGQLQPIRVRWHEESSRYVIVAGERRWRAARMAGLTSLSCVTMEGPISPADLLSLQLIENMVREDLKPIEQAKAFRAIMDLNGWSTHDVARELAIVQPSVVRALKLLELPPAVQEQVEQGSLPPATAYEVSKVEDPVQQVALASRAVAEGLSRDQVVEAVRRGSPRTAKPKGRGAKKPTTRVFRRAAGCTVTIENARGLDAATLRAAVADVMSRLETEAEPGEQAA